MRNYLIDSDGGVDAIKLQESDKPQPRPGEVQIQMRAASLNYRDLSVASGGYLRNNHRPIVPVSDGAGTISKLGEGVTRWKKGDRVSPIFLQKWIDGPPNDEILRSGLGGGIGGVLAEFVNVPEESLVAIPESMTFAEAACVPCAAVTAWHALFESGNLQAGQTVLCLGTGGVSMFALQFAKASGAKVIITSSDDQKLNVATGHGADETINYVTHPEWHREVQRLTSDRGVDHVVEVGGPGTLERSLKSTAVGGHVHLIGILDTPQGKVNPLLSIFNLLTIRGIYVGSRHMHESVLAMMQQHSIQPVIDQSFSFDEAPDAYRYMQSQKHVGKIVIEF
ncbi:zinc-dependent alcohol dehydrogenase family protein [Neorhodopirellula pilleata]|uniref:Alcohol dehydrogenase n=1 Tax=Neorhodopirellula pilleata TaxID=2714738 RepID=A0A5C6A2H8_9BACT|nr:NAD(P)-dependent alcohol dehydrogenase [Neorhodopirellula pilleata]TWT93615.1 alcohol dehydrogenase [Neorhodopirellula pilleata]